MNLVPSVTRTNENIVEFFREALALAESGEIHAAVIVMEHANGTTSDRWAFVGGIYPQKLLGSLWLCMSRMTKRYMEDNDGN